MEEVKTKSNNGIVIFLIIALCACVAFITFLIMHEDICTCPDCIIKEQQEEKVEENKEETEEIGSYPNLYTTNLNRENIITLFDRYIHVNGFVYEPYMDEIKYDKVTYIGYHENQKYYKISGTYKCNTTEFNCYYTPQDEDETGINHNLNTGIIVFEKDANSDKYTLKTLNSGMSYEDYTEVNEEVK